MANTPDLVRVGASGSVYVCNASDIEGANLSKRPSDVDSALDAVWTDLGVISEDGCTFARALTTEVFKGWGTGPIRTSVTDTEFTVQFSALETSLLTMELWLGVQNTGTGDDAVFAVPGTAVVVQKAIVIDWHEDIGGVDNKFRILLPRCEVSSYGDLQVNTANAVAYDLTWRALSDADKNAAYVFGSVAQLTPDEEGAGS